MLAWKRGRGRGRGRGIFPLGQAAREEGEEDRTPYGYCSRGTSPRLCRGNTCATSRRVKY